ncbi:TPA: hypothetical protein ND538_004800, partial [Serratia marcescens]|nr:hypothetical protein [Serratia marcescens]
LTILLGANSCGKSAIINSLLMISQSVDSAFRSESALRLNGSKVGMGEALNIIKDKNKDNKLTFEIEFDESTSIKSQIESAKRECLDAHFTSVRYVSQAFRRNRNLLDKAYPVFRELDNFYYGNDSFNVGQLRRISSKVSSMIRLYRGNKDELNKKTRFANSKSLSRFVNEVSFQRINDCLTGLMPLPLAKIAAQKVCYTFRYDKKTDSLAIADFCLFNRLGDVIARISADMKNDITIESNV